MTIVNIRRTAIHNPDANSNRAGDLKPDHPEYWWLPDDAEIFYWEAVGSNKDGNGNPYSYPKLLSVAWDLTVPPKTWFLVRQLRPEDNVKPTRLAHRVNQHGHFEVMSYWWGQCSAPFENNQGWCVNTIVTPADIPVEVTAYAPYAESERLVQP